MSSSSRARPLPPDERRAALIAAALPLVRKHGMSVTTRQLAEASGVAEGTIFRVFPDKDALVHASIDAAMDPAALLRELAGIESSRPLRERLVETATILQRWLVDVINLMTAVRMHGPPTKAEARYDSNAKINAAVVRVLEPDRDAFRCAPAEVVRLLRLVMFAGSHPLLAEGNLLTPEEIVTLLLDGVLARPDSGPAGPERRDTDRRDTDRRHTVRPDAAAAQPDGARC